VSSVVDTLIKPVQWKVNDLVNDFYGHNPPLRNHLVSMLGQAIKELKQEIIHYGYLRNACPSGTLGLSPLSYPGEGESLDQRWFKQL
jgi:hypothetical protein